jgi:pimeloyl-ACP methyl ester carboxylesterase
MTIFNTDIPDQDLLSKYAPAPSKFMMLNDMQIHFRDEGPQDAEPIVVLHGSQSSLHTWEAWSSLLRNQYRVISLDLPGHGFTSPMPDNDYSFRAIVEVIAAFVRALKLGKFTMVGNSWGGLIALHYAVWREEELSRLVLIDSAAYHYADPFSCRAARWPGVGELFCRITPQKMIREELESCYADPSKVTDEVFERYYKLLLRKGNRQAQIMINKPKDAYWAPQAVLDSMKSLKIPALIMWGERDPWLPVEAGERFANEIPNAVLRVYSNSGHLPMEEIPETSSADLHAFMRYTGKKELTAAA